MEYFKDYSAYLDGIAIFIVLTSILFAFYRGLVKEILGIGSWVLAAFAVIYAIPASRPYTADMFESKVVADIVVGVVVAITVLVICTLITFKSTVKIRGSALNGLDRTLGGIFGLARGVLIVVVLYIGATMIFTKELDDDVDHSILKEYLDDANDAFEDYVDSYGEEDNNLDELFEKLNVPEVKETIESTKEGYKNKERKSLDQLILETSDTE